MGRYRTTLLIEKEDDLYQFIETGKKFSMKISPEKSKCIITSKERFRCKIEIEITSYGEMVEEVRHEVTEANKVVAKNQWWKDTSMQLSGTKSI